MLNRLWNRNRNPKSWTQYQEVKEPLLKKQQQKTGVISGLDH